jgi:hypothetical protein
MAPTSTSLSPTVSAVQLLDQRKPFTDDHRRWYGPGFPAHAITRTFKRTSSVLARDLIEPCTLPKPTSSSSCQTPRRSSSHQRRIIVQLWLPSHQQPIRCRAKLRVLYGFITNDPIDQWIDTGSFNVSTIDPPLLRHDGTVQPEHSQVCEALEGHQVTKSLC